MQPALKEKPYGNWSMLSPDGEVMCRCSERRANWYLKRNIAEKVSDDPPAIRLLFTPNGKGNYGDAYGMAQMQNRCVVCGSEENLTKHHIVPYMYRQHLPNEIKGRSSHDIVAICVPDHAEYETVAMQLKKELFDEYGLEHTVDRMSEEMRVMKNIRSLCSAVIEKGHHIPPARLQTIMEQLTAALGHVPSIEEMTEICKITHRDAVRPASCQSAIDMVKKIIASNELQSFVSRWRQHFIDVMSPQYMPEYWDVNRPI